MPLDHESEDTTIPDGHGRAFCSLLLAEVAGLFLRLFPGLDITQFVFVSTSLLRKKCQVKQNCFHVRYGSGR